MGGSLIFIGMIALFASIVGGIIWIAHVMEKRRTIAMEEFARELGLNFTSKADLQLLSQLQNFQLFNSGRSKVMKNVIFGSTDYATISIFDYQYTTGSGKNKSTHQFSVVAMTSDQLNIPSFSLRPENFFDFFGSALGFQDIDFDRHPHFSKMYVLKGPDEQAIRDFFNDEVLDFFTHLNGISFEGEVGRFIYFVRGRKKTEQLQELMNDGYSIYTTLAKQTER